MSRALLIVDVQRDFVEGGSCAVAGGDAVAHAVGAYLNEHASDYEEIVASRDWHVAGTDNGGHFALDNEPDFASTWPVHCVAETEGASYHPAIDESLITIHINKGQDRPAFSLFEGTTAAGETMHQLVAERDITDVDVVGIATDHCVLAAASDALAAGLRVRVLAHLTVGVSTTSSAEALSLLASRGATILGDEAGTAAARAVV